jgi:GNAT superfamily N-acetyltransferase
MNNANYQLRKAKTEDLEEILTLVKELATFENAEDEVVADLNDYKNSFGTHFDCWLALYDSKVVGIALYYIGFSTWKGKMLYLDDLYISSAHRRKGLAKSLIHQLILEARQRGCPLIKWQVLDWNEPAISLYKSLGLTLEKNWYNCKGRVDDLRLPNEKVTGEIH